MMQKNLLIACIYTGLFTSPGSAQPPAGFVPPALHPAGARLETVPLGEGVFALISDRPPVDNAGFIIGERGVLVVDAHIDEAMAGQILTAVRRVTDKPILYLVNTNYHADHTFGNHAFPEDTLVVAHRETRRVMEGFEEQKRRMLVTVDGDRRRIRRRGAPAPRPGVRRARRHRPRRATGRASLLRHRQHAGRHRRLRARHRHGMDGQPRVGRGLAAVPARGPARDYAKTIRRFDETLPVRTFIPGHGAPAVPGILERYVDYLEVLNAALDEARRDSWSLERVLTVPLPERFAIDPELPSAPFYGGLHAFNLNRAFQEPAR